MNTFSVSLLASLALLLPLSAQDRPKGDDPSTMRRGAMQSRAAAQSRATPQGGGMNLHAFRLMAIQPEGLERMGATAEQVTAFNDLKRGMRERVGEPFKATRSAEEAYREALRAAPFDPEAAKAALVVASAAGAALREKDLEIFIEVRNALGPEVFAKMSQAGRNASAGGMDRQRMTERPAPAADKAPPWMNDKGERLKRPPVE